MKKWKIKWKTKNLLSPYHRTSIFSKRKVNKKYKNVLIVGEDFIDRLNCEGAVLIEKGKQQIVIANLGDC